MKSDLEAQTRGFVIHGQIESIVSQTSEIDKPDGHFFSWSDKTDRREMGFIGKTK